MATKTIDPANKSVRDLEHDIMAALEKRKASLPELALAVANVIYMSGGANERGCKLVSLGGPTKKGNR